MRVRYAVMSYPVNIHQHSDCIHAQVSLRYKQIINNISFSIYRGYYNAYSAPVMKIGFTITTFLLAITQLRLMLLVAIKLRHLTYYVNNGSAVYSVLPHDAL